MHHTLNVSECPYWMLSDADAMKKEEESKVEVDQTKLRNLIKRRGIYGDICQDASEAQLKYLLIINDNRVPLVIKELEDWVKLKGTQTHIPPAFYDRDGSFVQPPCFEMPVKHLLFDTPQKCEKMVDGTRRNCTLI